MIAKVVFLCTALAAVQASLHLSLVNTGSSVSSRQQDDFGNYGFNYGIVDGLGATNGRSEVGDAHGNKQGSYTLADIDGRARRVDYVADSLGFRAEVKTNEPGTALSAPAAALVASPYAGPVAPTAVGHTVAAVAPVAAPVYAGVPAVAAPVGYAAGAIGIAAPIGHSPVGIAAPIGHSPVGLAAPIGYAARPVGISGHLGYAAGPIGISGHLGYANHLGLAAPLNYAGHLGYTGGLAKAIY